MASGSWGHGSKAPKLSSFYDSIRFRPQEEYAALFSPYSVQYYSQVWGQNLFMQEGGGYIDVRFVDPAAALHAVRHVPREVFDMQAIKKIKLDNIRVISPGSVRIYQPPRDRDHYDGTPCVPRGWNNPFPTEFRPPPADPEKSPPARPLRFKPVFPRPAQPPAPSPNPPFDEPQWPPLPPLSSDSVEPPVQ